MFLISKLKEKGALEKHKFPEKYGEFSSGNINSEDEGNRGWGDIYRGKGGKTGGGQRGNSLIIKACGQCKDSEKWRLMGEHGAED